MGLHSFKKKVDMNHLKNIVRFKLLSRINEKFLETIINILGPRFCAYLTYWSVDLGEMKSGKKNILCLYRESFIKDINALRRYGEFNYIVVTAGFTRFQKAWLPEALVEQTFYQRNIEKHPVAVKKSQQYAETLYRLMARKFTIHGFLTGNFDYWQDHYFKVIAKNNKIPFLVLSREHPVIPEVCNIVKARYARAGYQFHGDAIAVAGQSTFDVIKQSRTICSEDKIRITGLPRYDDWRAVAKDKPLAERRYITLLTFTSGYFADETFKEVLVNFCEISESYREANTQFLVKTKDRFDTQKVRRLIESVKGFQGVIVTDKTDLFELLPDSRLIIGYNSLSLIEGLMSGAQIAIPNWGQCLSHGPRAMYTLDNPLVNELIRFPKDRDELEQLIDSAINDEVLPIDNKKSENLIQQYIYIPKNNTSTHELENLLSECEQAIA